MSATGCRRCRSKTKLAELGHDEARICAFSKPTTRRLLMVLDKDKAGRSEYAIERDDGLVADLALFMRAATLS